MERYSGTDKEGFTWEERMEVRPRKEVADYRPRVRIRKKRKPSFYDDMVVPGSIRTSREIGLK